MQYRSAVNFRTLGNILAQGAEEDLFKLQWVDDRVFAFYLKKKHCVPDDGVGLIQLQIVPVEDGHLSKLHRRLDRRPLVERHVAHLIIHLMNRYCVFKK